MPYADPEKRREQSRRWYRENREKKLADQKRRDDVQRDGRAVYLRSYRQRPHVRAAERERARRIREECPEIHRDSGRRRYTKKKGVRQGDPREMREFDAILRSAPCELCGSWEDIQIDHIDPVSRSGDNDWTNFAGLCATCNKSKSAKPLLLHMRDQLDRVQ